MNMVLKQSFKMNSSPENHPENLAAAYKERSGGEVLENPFSGGDGVSKRHTPIAIAQRGLSAPTVPGAAMSFSPPIEVIPGHTRILLSEAASRHLEAAGPECFVIVATDKSDQHSGRWVIHLMPCSYTLANSAVRVAQGLSTEKRPKPTPATPKPALTPKQLREA